MKRYGRVKRCLFGCFSRYHLLILWILLIVVVFIYTVKKYKDGLQYYYLRKMFGWGLYISRSCGSIINVSCAILLLPISHFFITFVRKFLNRVPMRFMKSFTDHSKAIHITCAFTVVLASIGHTIAHITNAFNFYLTFNSSQPTTFVVSAEISRQSPLFTLFVTVPGLTGFAMLIILTVMLITSLKYIRKRHYNVFWYTHKLYMIFFILLICHPLSGFLKEQMNTDSHPPGCIYIDVRDYTGQTNTSHCFNHPQFIPLKSLDWLWIVISLCLYLLNCIIRIFYRHQCVNILEINYLPCCVIELTLEKKQFHCKPGQYVLVQCPSIAVVEWHPFSISRCHSKRESGFKIHIKSTGDWSNSLHEKLSLIKTSECIFQTKNYNVKLFVDGPFSSPLQDVLQSPFSVCIAGGIGVTPFASILYSILADDVDIRNLQRLHFIWLCQDVQSFIWFAELLCQLHCKLWNINRPDFLEILLYATRTCTLVNSKLCLGGRYPLLSRRLQFKRPLWSKMFKEWALAYSGKVVNVFCCGPHSLNKEIREHCRTSSCNDNVTFSYFHESFS